MEEKLKQKVNKIKTETKIRLMKKYLYRNYIYLSYENPKENKSKKLNEIKRILKLLFNTK